MSPLSVDLLHQVFQFFVSSDQVVDGKSLRVASLVCKQWRDVSNSRSLWAIPARVQERLDAENKKSFRFDTIYNSLQIRDESFTSSCTHKSLVGFVNEKQYNGEHPELYFFVRERASGSRFLLSISKHREILPSIVSDLYVNHFELKETFLEEYHNDRNTDNFYPSQRFPLGVEIWNGRFVRWYRSETEQEARSIIEHISPEIKKSLHEPLPLKDHEQKISAICHLMDLERTSFLDRENESCYTEGRQHVADWLAEIVECFELEDTTMFQAMLLFDQFNASCGERVQTSRLQLLGGACILIASKCNKRILSEKDISFCCDNTFDVDRVRTTEMLILDQLEWKLACPSSIQFISAFSNTQGIEKDTQMFCLSCYISELSLAFDTSFRFPPSIIAASSMVLARYTLRNDDGRILWPKELADATGFHFKDLVECSVRLSNDSERVRPSRLDMIYRRYSKISRHSVADITIPVLTSAIIIACEERLRSRLR